MKQRIGFIGSGNMGLAIINGLITSGVVLAKQITVFDTHSDRLKALSDKIGFNTATSEENVTDQSDILFLAVKPSVIPSVLNKIKHKLTQSTIVISIAAGVTLTSMEKIIGSGYKIIRVMPNTPALVNAGMSSLTANKNVTEQELGSVSSFFNSLGLSDTVPESLIHAVTGISGSAPAYVFMFIEAMADAAVLAGMSRDKAYKFAAQAVLGSAKMVLETGRHPGDLKDMVCSPGGTTIEAVKVLEETGFRASVIDAVTACIDKSKRLSGE